VMNDSLKHSCVVSVTKTNVKICENATILIDEYKHMIECDTNKDWEVLLGVLMSENDEVDAYYISSLTKYNRVIEPTMMKWILSYGSFLVTYVPITEIDSASNHSCGSNTSVDFGNKNCSDEVDASYRSLLATYDMVIEIDSAITEYGCSNSI